MTDFWADADVIYAYTRAQAIDDGVLVDVSSVAREAGFKFPVAMTIAAWVDFVEWDGDMLGHHQDEAGRLWDVLWMAFCAVKASRAGGDLLEYQLSGVARARPTAPAALCTLVAHCGPGDAGEPVVTIMLVGED